MIIRIFLCFFILLIFICHDFRSQFYNFVYIVEYAYFYADKYSKIVNTVEEISSSIATERRRINLEILYSKDFEYFLWVYGIRQSLIKFWNYVDPTFLIKNHYRFNSVLCKWKCFFCVWPRCLSICYRHYDTNSSFQKAQIVSMQLSVEGPMRKKPELTLANFNAALIF